MFGIKVIYKQYWKLLLNIFNSHSFIFTSVQKSMTSACYFQSHKYAYIYLDFRKIFMHHYIFQSNISFLESLRNFILEFITNVLFEFIHKPIYCIKFQPLQVDIIYHDPSSRRKMITNNQNILKPCINSYHPLWQASYKTKT